ncbi:Alpha/Beta hydrolase protein [Xylaria venustula]|nr:Alpha/Beta hydrolase protein [Xylaria venustula]
MSAELPVLVLVPGAFGKPEGFDKLIPHLNGLQTHPGAYPSCDPPDPTNATCADDIAALRKTLLSLLDQQQRDVVILAHSYGGVVAGGAAKDLDKDSREAQGKTSAVVGLIYVAGNITLEGECLFDAVGGAYPPFIKYKPSNGLVIIEPAMDILFNDCDDLELEKSVYPHAHHAFETKASAPAWQDKGFDGRRLYIRTTDDHCNPSSLQVIDFDTGHMPFVSQPKALAEQVVKFVEHIRRLGIL